MQIPENFFHRQNPAPAGPEKPESGQNDFVKLLARQHKLEPLHIRVVELRHLGVHQDQSNPATMRNKEIRFGSFFLSGSLRGGGAAGLVGPRTSGQLGVVTISFLPGI